MDNFIMHMAMDDDDYSNILLIRDHDVDYQLNSGLIINHYDETQNLELLVNIRPNISSTIMQQFQISSDDTICAEKKQSNQMKPIKVKKQTNLEDSEDLDEMTQIILSKAGIRQIFQIMQRSMTNGRITRQSAMDEYNSRSRGCSMLVDVTVMFRLCYLLDKYNLYEHTRDLFNVAMTNPAEAYLLIQKILLEDLFFLEVDFQKCSIWRIQLHKIRTMDGFIRLHSDMKKALGLGYLICLYESKLDVSTNADISNKYDLDIYTPESNTFKGYKLLTSDMIDYVLRNI